MKKCVLGIVLCLCILMGILPVHIMAADSVSESGTWGGIDWTLDADGTLTIAPTKGEPTQLANKKTAFTVGEWPEAVRYNTSGSAAAIEGWPYDRDAVKKLVIEEGVTSIGSFTAQGFTNLTGEVVIPSTVTYIGQEAFLNSTMTKLIFAEGGTGELMIAQGGLKNLIVEEIVLPEDRPAIHLKAWMFNNCDNLKHIVFPANVQSIGGTNYVDYNYFSTSHNNGNHSQLTFYNDKLETITFGSEEVKELYFTTWGNPITTIGVNGNHTTAPTAASVGLTYGTSAQSVANLAKPGDTVTLLANCSDALVLPAGVTLDENGYEFTGSCVNAPADPVVQNSIVYGAKLSEISLPAGWAWKNPDTMLTVNNTGYVAYYIPADTENYDWSVIAGWNETEKRIERTVDVTVAPKDITVAMVDCEIYVGGWPEYSYTVEGLLGDDELISGPSYGTSADRKKAGVYTVYLDGADAGPNYTVTHVEGKLTVKEIPEAPKPAYAVTVGSVANGSVIASIKTAYAGDTVTLTLVPNGGYALGTLAVSAGGSAVAATRVSDTVYTFVMPGADVNISAVFVKTELPADDCDGTGDCPMTEYTDLEAAAWYHDGVHYCIENGLMVGVDKDNFEPEKAMTRAELVSVLWRMEGEPKVDHELTFNDVAEGAWYTEAIGWANSVGIVNGYSARKFGPDDAVTREQMVAILYRYAASKGVVAAVSLDEVEDFADWKHVSNWAETAVAWACDEGLLAGKAEEGKVILAPRDAAGRAQAANIIYRYIENI